MLLSEQRIAQIVLAGLIAGLVGTGAYLLPWLVNDLVIREAILIAACFTVLIIVFGLQVANCLEQRQGGKPRKSNA